MNVPFRAQRFREPEKVQGVTAVLGPTNTGKTHYAIERMLSHPTGMIGLPLRLLAREVYNRVVEKIGPASVALVTGEEKIKPKSPRYWISTVEAMPRDLDLSFVAIDEIQLAADLDRGHVFTDRLLHRRGRDETLLIGAATMQKAILGLLPGTHILSRPRLSKLSFAGEKKMTKLPRRSAIVAFSAEEVYAIAEWIRRQKGGAAVVLGALSPRTRNAQVEMFQSGDVDYIIATDAIGMGLNLDVDHIAFAADRKFDGWQYRRLTPAEFGQIAGRAGRHVKDGTFGSTGRCLPFEEELVEALEDHRFDSLRMLQWRNTDLDFSSLATLAASLDVLPNQPGLTRAPLAQDQLVFELAAKDEKVLRIAKTRADIGRLWECCQIPDFRKLSPTAHGELVLSVFGFVVRAGYIAEDWYAKHIAALARVDGDIDTLSGRIAQIRTWTFIANRSDWLRDPEHWQGVTRQVEDTLSDALHERLAQRFVDRRTSVLMRRLRENAIMEAEVTSTGDVLVEGQHIGQLNGFRFTADPQAAGEAAKALNAAALKALASEIEGRANRVHEAVDEAFVLSNDGIIRWLGEPVAKISSGDHILTPSIRILSDEQLSGQALELVQKRLDLWLAQHVKKLLGLLIDLEKGEGLEGIARGIAFQIAESLGVLERSKVADDVKNLPQDARAALRKFGIRFGAYSLYLPNLLKPAPRALAAQLWALKHGGVEEIKGLDEVPHLASSGRTSFAADKDVPKGFYRAAGFRVCGERAVRVDILERLADLIRPAVAYRPGTTPGDPPAGAADGDGFVVTVAMTSLAGCSGESFASILRSLSYVADRRKGPPITVPLLPQAPNVPLKPVLPHAAEGSADEDAVKGASGAEAEPGPSAILEAEPISGEHISPAGAEPLPAVPEPQKPEAEFTQLEPLAESPAPAPVQVAAEVETVLETAAVTELEAASSANDDGVPAREMSAEASALEGSGPAAGIASEAVELTASGPLPVEEVLIEVWRPHRQHHQPRRNDARPARKPYEARHSAPAVQGEANGASPQVQEKASLESRAEKPGAGTEQKPAQDHQKERRHFDRRSGERRQFPQPEAQGGVAPAGQAEPVTTGATPREVQKSFKDKPRFDRPKEGRRPGPHDPRPREQQRFSGPRNDDRRDNPSAKPEKRSHERPPDPNSPFAKLLVLKAQMEEKKKP